MINKPLRLNNIRMNITLKTELKLKKKNTISHKGNGRREEKTVRVLDLFGGRPRGADRNEQK